MAAASGSTQRQARSIRNDSLILDAAVRLADEHGWSALLPARVAQAAGLSRSTVSDRFQDRSTLAAWAWTQRLAPAVVQTVEQVVAVARWVGPSRPSPGSVDARDLARVMLPFVEPDQEMRAAAELLVVSCFDARVHDAVGETLGAQLGELLTPVPRRLSRADAARRAFLVIVALGSLLETRRHHGARFQLESEWERLAAALLAPDSIRKVPDVFFEHWDGVFDFDTGDALLDRLLEATRDEIGRKGYEATTIDGIARAAGRTKGLVFSRYPSKKELFKATIALYSKGMFDLNEQAVAALLTKMSPGLAEAAVYREYMRPGREHLHVFSLEQHRLTWHDDDMRKALADSMADAIAARLEADPSRTREMWEAFNFIGAAQGVGTLLLASCCPVAWTLPDQAMTVPLNEQAPEAGASRRQ